MWVLGSPVGSGAGGTVEGVLTFFNTLALYSVAALAFWNAWCSSSTASACRAGLWWGRPRLELRLAPPHPAQRGCFGVLGMAQGMSWTGCATPTWEETHKLGGTLPRGTAPWKAFGSTRRGHSPHCRACGLAVPAQSLLQ